MLKDNQITYYSSGSIGKQSLDICLYNKKSFEVYQFSSSDILRNDNISSNIKKKKFLD